MTKNAAPTNNVRQTELTDPEPASLERRSARPIMVPTANFKSDLLAAMPALRALALSRYSGAGSAEDLVQETLIKAWANWSSFQPGSRMEAWLFTILRHEYYSAYRRRRHEVPDSEGLFAARLATGPTQECHMAFREFQVVFAALTPTHREALILVGALGFSYADAAGNADCAIGTMKSRTARARGKLAENYCCD
jgi:RNA polymerase sigma-70 factor, ECF subfamily